MTNTQVEADLSPSNAPLVELAADGIATTTLTIDYMKPWEKSELETIISIAEAEVVKGGHEIYGSSRSLLHSNRSGTSYQTNHSKVTSRACQPAVPVVPVCIILGMNRFCD
jgi:hypothetical protein